MADDDDVRGAPGAEDILAPSGPRRASYTPAPNTAESLQAAANLFDDDAIAEALSAELARVASGPIPIQRSATPLPVPVPVPEPVPEPEPIVESVPEPVAEAAAEAQSEPAPAPAAEQAPTAVPLPEPTPEIAPEPVFDAVPEPTVAPDAFVAPEPEPEPEPAPAPAPEDAPEAQADPEPVVAATPSPVVPQGPPDWATPLFGQPTPVDQDNPALSSQVSDPFAPSAPPFAPSTGPFPPPGDSAPAPEPISTPFPTTETAPESLRSSDSDSDSDALRALYAAAPAPTVPAADAPPPPGYTGPDAGAASDAPGSETLSAMDQLQAQLDQRDRDSREFPAAVSVPSAPPAPPAAFVPSAPPAASVPSAPPAAPIEEPAAFLPPPAEEPTPFYSAPAEEPAAFLPPPAEEPAAFLPPPPDDPAPFLAPPIDTARSFFAPPVEEPAAPAAPVEEPAAFLTPPAFLPPPVEEPASFLAPPAEEPASFLPPPAQEPASFFPPPTEEPASFFARPADLPDTAPPAAVEDAASPAQPENPFDIFGSVIDDAPSAPEPLPPVGSEPTPFPGFGPPTDTSTMDFSAPADPHELHFGSQAVQDAPIFLEPTPTASIPSPPGPPSWNIDEPASAPTISEPTTSAPPASVPPASVPTAEEFAAAEPTPEEREAAGALPALVEPPAHDGLADLWRTASEQQPSAPVPTPVADAPAPPVEPSPFPFPTFEAAPVTPSATAPETSPATTAFESSPPFTAPPAAGFDDLLGGAPPQPDLAAPSAPWVGGGDPGPGSEPAPPADGGTEDRRPFGEGVDRDEAIDPSDSIFGAQRAPVSVNTAGVAALPEYIVVESRPISVLRPMTEPVPVLAVAPRILPAEPVGLEPTPLEQRVGRAARLFWLWFAANSSVAAIVFGSILFALGMSLRQAVVATLAGVALSFLPLGLGTLAGKRSGQPTMVVSRATFGVVGNIVPALIALVSRLFWAGGLLWVLGAGTANILHGAKLTDGFTTDQLTIIVMVLGSIVTVVIAYLGYALVARIQLVISVISGIAIVGFIALTLRYVNFTTALSTQDGPWILVVTGAVLVFSFVGLAWANSSADVARYQRPGSSGAASMLWATFGVGLPSFVLIAYGALLAASNAKLAASIAADPLDSLGRLLPGWYPLPLLIATALSLASGIVIVIYSGGFALQAAGLRLRRPLATLLVGVLMLAVAIIMTNALTDFSQLFRDFATTVAVPVAAWAGIFGAEMLLRRRRFDAHSLLNRGGVYPDVRWGNLVALVVISAVGYGFLSATLTGLSWEGYLFEAFGVPRNGALAGSDLGVLVALVLGLVFPLAAGRSGIHAQESVTRVH